MFVLCSQMFSLAKMPICRYFLNEHFMSTIFWSTCIHYSYIYNIFNIVNILVPCDYANPCLYVPILYCRRKHMLKCVVINAQVYGAYSLNWTTSRRTPVYLFYSASKYIISLVIVIGTSWCKGNDVISLTTPSFKSRWQRFIVYTTCVYRYHAKSKNIPVEVLALQLFKARHWRQWQPADNDVWGPCSGRRNSSYSCADGEV